MRYQGGLGKLDETQQDVVEMQETLIRLQPLLVTAAQDVQKIVANIETESVDVAKVEKIVKVDEEAALASILIIYNLWSEVIYKTSNLD
jgi:dynein heavy chain